MSVRLNQELSSWKVVLAKLRRIETTWRGLPLSRVDHQTWTEAVLLATLVLSDLSNRYEGCGSHRDHVLWAFSACHTDVSEMASFLSDVIPLFRGYSVDGDMTYADFKHQLADKYPFAGSLLAPIKGAIELFLSSPNPSTFYPPYQFLSFLTHLSLSGLDMQSELEEEYCENEEFVRNYKRSQFLISRMREVMTDWFRDFSIDVNTFMPKHGPKSVAEMKGDTSKDSKYRLLKPDFPLWGTFLLLHGIDVRDYLPLENSGVTSRCAEVVFVPKSMKTKRVISKEPATLQYFQQGLSGELDRHFRSNPELSAHIDLHDQERQRNLALYASRTKEFATVDLSAASDTVSCDLVESVFRDTPIYDLLWALRSTTVRLPSGTQMGIAKYAPMGSALCFPIESLIFACICECTVRYVYHTTGELFSQYLVYGDDIIIPDPCLEDLVTNLRLCGFRVNEDKSYGGSMRFRESCGMDAYDGVCVTPMRISRRFVSRNVHIRSAGMFAGLIDMANNAHIFEFGLLRRYLVDKLIHETGFRPFFSQEGLGCLYSPIPSNFHLLSRWNDDYQRDEIKATKLIAHQSQSSSCYWDSKRRRYVDRQPLDFSEDIRLYEWLRLAYAQRELGMPRDPQPDVEEFKVLNPSMRVQHRDLDPLSDDFPVKSRTGSVGTYLAKCWVVKPDAG